MTADNERSTILRNATSSYGVRGLLLLSTLLVTPYLFRRLGPAGFGTWSVMFTLTTVFNLLELGVSAGLVRFVAAYHAGGRRRELERIVGAGVALMGGVGLLALAASVAAAFLLQGLAATGDRDGFRTGMLVLGVAMLARFPCVAYAATLNGYQRYDLSNASLALLTVGSAVGSVVAIEAGAGVLGLAVANAVALVAGGLLYAVLLARVSPGLPLRPRLGDLGAIRRLAGFSSLTFLADGMIFVGQRMDVVVIAAIRNAVTAAPYAAALKLQSGLQALTLPLMDMLMPMVSGLWERGRRDEVGRRLAFATRATLQLTLPLAVALALFSTDIVDVWLGSGAPDITAAIIVVLVAVQTVTLTSFPAEKVLIGIGRARVVAALAVVEGLSNLGVSIGLVTAYGAIGAALGTLFTNAVLAPLRFPLVCRAIGYPVGRFLRQSVGAAAASSLPALGAMVAVWLFLPEGIVRLVVGMSSGVVLALPIAVGQIGLDRIRSLGRRGRSGALPEIELGPSTGIETSSVGSP